MINIQTMMLRYFFKLEFQFTQLMSEGKLLLSLFYYVKQNEDKSLPREWSPAQFEELQLHAMSSLCSLSAMMMEDYMVCQGNTRLLLLLEWCLNDVNNLSFIFPIFP